eukprot:scaffold168864_cov29-Tisochrysis_lutea.AAC.1
MGDKRSMHPTTIAAASTADAVPVASCATIPMARPICAVTTSGIKRRRSRISVCTSTQPVPGSLNTYAASAVASEETTPRTSAASSLASSSMSVEP